MTHGVIQEVYSSTARVMLFWGCLVGCQHQVQFSKRVYAQVVAGSENNTEDEFLQNNRQVESMNTKNTLRVV